MMKSALMLAVNPNALREENDFYATSPNAITTALPMLQYMGLSMNVWECACGKGHISNVLKEAGYNVISTDKIDRGYGVGGVDFLTCGKTFNGDILTNPPYRLAVPFIRRAMAALREGQKAFFMLRIQFLEGRARKQLFKEFPPKYIAVYSERQKCAKDGDFEKHCKNASTQAYAWFVFEKGYKGITQILWI